VGIHTQHAFLWADGVMTNLGTLGGSTHAVDINEAGQVVGGSYTAGAFSHYAFVWEDGVMTNLGTLGGSTSSATDINEAGQVVGYSDTVGIHTQHAFLATPATPQTPQEATQSIIDTIAALVASGDLPHGVGNALTAKLEAAIQQLDRGNTRAAANQLTAFINQVESLIAEGLLSAEDGEPLIEAARDILETIT
jgi:probable HAF family extracellular repeat protein